MKTVIVLLAIVIVLVVGSEGQSVPDDCQEKPILNPERSCLALLQRWKYDDGTNSCVNFFYGGCGRVSNTFSSLSDCESTCVTPTQTSV